MIDKSTSLILEALDRAATMTSGAPLFGTSRVPGIFGATAAAKRAAQRCKDEELLQIMRTETIGKKLREICAISDKGLAFLQRKKNGTDKWSSALLAHLQDWKRSAATQDCPLPTLLRASRLAYRPLSIGQFHDGLRLLYDDKQIYLHPWTGPLHELPEPSCALLIGHEIAYYASLR